MHVPPKVHWATMHPQLWFFGELEHGVSYSARATRTYPDIRWSARQLVKLKHAGCYTLTFTSTTPWMHMKRRTLSHTASCSWDPELGRRHSNLSSARLRSKSGSRIASQRQPEASKCPHQILALNLGSRYVSSCASGLQDTDPTEERYALHPQNHVASGEREDEQHCASAAGGSIKGRKIWRTLQSRSRFGKGHRSVLDAASAI